MHPEIERELAVQRVEELRRAGAPPGRRVRPAQKVRLDGEVVLRGARAADRTSLVALAALDGALPPVGPALVAQVRGAIVAVLPLDGGRPFADPFRRTDDLIALLEERARQIDEARGATVRRSRLRWHAPAALRRLV
jgi:hypothetical protein